ncbi:MAG: ABC transporter ATP-binding protein [Pseudobutyrivibrio sp.]|nr:ABC transporter ATP-binding protein [Pseudobutyrivibrio sp.]
MKVLLDKLTKVFPNRNKKIGGDVVAVDNFSLEIPDGKLVALLGPSGCGKSTILFMICGLYSPTEGEIYFGEEKVTSTAPEDRGVGVVFQNYALYPHLSVEKNITFPLENFKGKDRLTKEEMHEKALEAAKIVQIEEYMQRKPSELSGGQQQRVAIARAIVKRPRILLLDEPLSNLDARLRLATREEIRRIQKETGITTIFVTHDQEEAMSISDFIVVMKDGALMQQGKPQEVYSYPNNLFVARFLGTPQINVFDGEVKDETLFIDGQPVLKTQGVSDRPVYVGIRPEGFVLSENGAFAMDLERVEVKGRDISIMCHSNAKTDGEVTVLIDSENEISEGTKTVRFDLRPFKVNLFDKETEERISFK